MKVAHDAVVRYLHPRCSHRTRTRTIRAARSPRRRRAA